MGDEDPVSGRLFAALTEGLTNDQKVIVRRLMAAHVTFLVEAIRLADEQLAQD